MKHCCTLIAIVLCLATATANAGKTAEELVEQLQTGNYQSQVESRQMLVRHGAEAVPHLIPLLGNDNQVVSKTAFRILHDIVNELTASGLEHDRQLSASYLIESLDGDASPDAKRQTLRLLPCLVNEFDVIGPIAALLKDETLREEARRCLESIVDIGAMDEIAHHLENTEGDFLCACLRSLGRHPELSRDGLIEPYLEHSNPEVRLSAAAAMASPATLKQLRTVVDKADDKTRAQAIELWMRAADHRGFSIDESAGGGYEIHQPSIEVFYSVLAMTADTSLRSMAITRLMKHGTQDDLKRVIELVLDDEGNDLEPALIEGTRLTSHTAAIIEAFPRFEKHMQLSLLDALARPGADHLVQFMNSHLTGNDSELSEAALDALAVIATQKALKRIEKYATGAEDDSRDAAIARLKTLATKLTVTKTPGAGDVYLTIYTIAPNTETKRYALQGLLRHPSESAWNAASDAIDDPELSELATSVLIWCVHHWPNRDADLSAMLKRLDLLAKHATTTSLVDQVAQLGRALPGGDVVAPKLGFVTQWQLAGPFPWQPDSGFKDNPVNAPNVDPSATYNIIQQTITWQDVTAPDASGKFDVAEVVGKRDRATIYALATINVEDETDAMLLMGSDDGIKAWLNGKVVHENDTARGCNLDEDIVEVHLNKGNNKLLVQVTQDIFGWSYCVRLTDRQGKPLAFTQ